MKNDPLYNLEDKNSEKPEEDSDFEPNVGSEDEEDN